MAINYTNKKNSAHQIPYTCVGYNQSLEGIINVRGEQVAVKGLIKGESAHIDLKHSRGKLRGKIAKIISASPDRIKPNCPHFLTCGGCQMLHMSQKLQADIKQKLTSKHLKAFAKPKSIASMTDPLEYRNKAHYSFAYSSNHNIISGLYEEYSHRTLDIKRCLLHDKKSDAIIATIKELMNQYGVKPYDEDKKTGHLRYVLTRVAKGTGQILVCLVTGDRAFPNKKEFTSDLIKRHADITTLVQSVNSESNSLVLGKKIENIYGRGYIEDKLLGLSFNISASTFYQINYAQTKKLYNEAIKLAKLNKNQTVLDAYCGIGTIALCLANQVKSVVGVEINATSIENAKINAENNHIKNATFVQADAANYLKTCQKGIFDTVFIDPPRSGASKELIDGLLKHSPSKIVYISCSPKTQARDLKQLKRGGYKIDVIKPFDMFPQTLSIETVALLSKLDVDKHIAF